MKNLYLFWVGLLCITTYTCYCQNDKKIISSTENLADYQPLQLPNDITKLWVQEGELTKDTIAIFLQGGPHDYLKVNKNPKTHWRYLPNYKNYSKIHLHHSNTYYPEMFSSKDKFTLENARTETENSSKILYRTISHFKSQGKTVYVFGHSYGAYIIQHYLTTHESIADKYIIVSGRIIDPEIATANQKKGINGSYENGTDYKSNTTASIQARDEIAAKKYHRKQLLKAAIGDIDYSEKLKNIDLEGVIYVYGSKDSRVGRLTQKEITFLESKGVSVFSCNYEHGDTVYGLVEALMKNKIRL